MFANFPTPLLSHYTLPLKAYFNPLPSGTLATFFLTAIGQIKHTEEGDISREKDDSDDVTAAREGRRR
jgi:hypothetical protein